MNKPRGPSTPDKKKKEGEVAPEEDPLTEPMAVLPSADDDAWLDAETFDSLVSSMADEFDDESHDSDEPVPDAEPSEDSLAGVEPSEDSLAGVEPSEDSLTGVEPSEDSLAGAEPSEDSLAGTGVEFLSDDFFEPIKDARQKAWEEPTVKIPATPEPASARPSDASEPAAVSSDSGERCFESMTEMSFEVEFDSSESRRENRSAQLRADDEEDSLDLSMQAVLPSVMEQDTDIPNDKLLDLLAVVQEIHRAASKDVEAGEQPRKFQVGPIESSRRGDVVRARLDVHPMQVTVELAFGAMSVSTIALDVEFASVEAPSHQQLPAATADYRSLKGDHGHFSQIRYERDRAVADEVFGVLSQDALAEVHRFACEVIALVRQMGE